MHKYLKLLITMLSTGAIVGCGQQSKVGNKNTNTTDNENKTEEGGLGGGQGITPNNGSWPVLDKLPISGSLGPSKRNFFSDRIMESRFNTWKGKKDAFAKALYATSDQFETDSKAYYKGSKDDWFSSAGSTAAYNTWRNGAGKAALTTLWRATTDYTTKRNTWVAGGVSTKRNKATWLGLADSTTPYNTWRVKRKAPLKTAWEATTTGATSFTTKLAAYASSHTTDTKEKYADLAASNTDYNNWRLTRTAPLKTAWEATGTSAGEFLNLVNTWFTSWATASIDTEAEWEADAASNTAYNAWKAANANTDAQKKAIWEDTTSFYNSAKTTIPSSRYFDNQVNNFEAFIKTAATTRVLMDYDIRITSQGNRRLRGTDVFMSQFLGSVLLLLDGLNYNYGTLGDDAANLNGQAGLNRIIAKWDEVFNEIRSKPAVRVDVISAFDAIQPTLVDTNYNAYAKTQYKLAANQAAYNTAFAAWDTEANLKAAWKELPASATAYENYKKDNYKTTVTSAVYNTGLDAWSNTKANGLATYKTSTALTTDYNTWIGTQYKAATATYNRDLDAWSATKANGVNLYNADAESTAAYNSWVDPNIRSIAKYNSNHLGQFDTDLGLWTANKTNGKATYFAAATSDTVFGSWTNPNPNDLTTYGNSPMYNTNFDNFVTNHLTWSTYSNFFKNQKYNLDSFKNLYRKYLLDE